MTESLSESDSTLLKISAVGMDASESVFGPEHLVEDEKVLSIEIEHSEGDFPSLSIVIKNPRIGLLAPARKTWVWLSHGGTPLFFGRLVGVPSNINQNAVTLEFVARPADYAAQKSTLAGSLRVLPYYDPVFITPDAQADPDTVLEARPAMWHIDRTTLAVTTSHTVARKSSCSSVKPKSIVLSLRAAPP